MLLIDSSAWAALFIEKSRQRELARETFERLLSNQESLVTTDYILDETYTLIRSRTGKLYPLKAFDDIIKESVLKKSLTVQWIDEILFQEARRLFFKYADHQFSFTDCASFAVARRLRIKQIFSFDRDFIVMGFDVIPRRD